MNIIQDIYSKEVLALTEKSYAVGDASEWGTVIKFKKASGTNILFVKSITDKGIDQEPLSGYGAFLDYLEEIVLDRKNNPTEKSYTSSLFAKGINKVAQKVGEEAVEVVIEAKDDNKELFLNESSDLLYHLIVLIVAKEYTLDEVISILKSRNT